MSCRPCRTGTGDFAHGGFVVAVAVQGLEGVVEQALDHVGVQIGGAEDHGLFFAEGVELLCELLADDAVEVFVDDAAVERFDVEVQLVVQLGGFDFAGAEVDGADRARLCRSGCRAG
jgi:hypothetical protein